MGKHKHPVRIPPWERANSKAWSGASLSTLLSVDAAEGKDNAELICFFCFCFFFKEGGVSLRPRHNPLIRVNPRLINEDFSVKGYKILL